MRGKWHVLIILSGLILRLIDISQPFSGLGKWNEGHYAVTALNYFNYGIMLPMNEYGLDLTTTPLYSWLIYTSFLIFGVHEWAARLPSLFFGIISVILVYHISEKLYEKRVAVISTLIAAIAPGIVYFSRNIQLESMFTAFSLASVLFLMYYKDTGDAKWFVASGIYLSIAVLTKYPAILTYPALLWILFKYGEKKGDKNLLRLALYLILPIIPSLIWLLYALSVKPALTIWYFYKPEAPVWMLSTANTALYSALTKFIPEHFGYVFYLLFLVSLPFLLKERRKHAPVMLFTFTWLFLIFLFPDFYLANMYYHYTMLYGMSILLGYFLATVWDRLPKTSDVNTKTIGTVALVLMLLFSIYQYNSFFHGYYTDFSKVNETEPFYSAKKVARENIDHELVVVDFPQTMFYAGGDPAYVRPAYYNEGILEAIKEDKYSYFVLYYSANATIKKALGGYNYTQIAPRAWYKKISNSSS